MAWFEHTLIHSQRSLVIALPVCEQIQHNITTLQNKWKAVSPSNSLSLSLSLCFKSPSFWLMFFLMLLLLSLAPPMLLPPPLAIDARASALHWNQVHYFQYFAPLYNCRLYPTLSSVFVHLADFLKAAHFKLFQWLSLHLTDFCSHSFVCVHHTDIDTNKVKCSFCLFFLSCSLCTLQTESLRLPQLTSLISPSLFAIRHSPFTVSHSLFQHHLTSFSD